MQSSVATECCHHSEGISSQTYGIDKRSGVSRLLFRLIISKFPSANLTGDTILSDIKMFYYRTPETLALTAHITWLIWTGRIMSQKGRVVLLPSHTARQVRGFECRDLGFDTRIVTALVIMHSNEPLTHANTQHHPVSSHPPWLEQKSFLNTTAKTPKEKTRLVEALTEMVLKTPADQLGPNQVRFLISNSDERDSNL